MNEQSVARMAGADVARSGWPATPGRADAPRPEIARSEAPRAAQLPPGASLPADTTSEQDSAPNRRSSARDAAFPTSYARFSIDAETQKLSIAIVDAVTDEVIREIPPEQVQRIAEDLQSLARRGSIGKRSGHADGAEQAMHGVDRYV